MTLLKAIYFVLQSTNDIYWISNFNRESVKKMDAFEARLYRKSLIIGSHISISPIKNIINQMLSRGNSKIIGGKRMET